MTADLQRALLIKNLKQKIWIMFIPNKSMSHLVCVSESGAAASQTEHGGWMCWDQLELSRQGHVFWHGHGLTCKWTMKTKVA